MRRIRRIGERKTHRRSSRGISIRKKKAKKELGPLRKRVLNRIVYPLFLAAVALPSLMHSVNDVIHKINPSDLRRSSEDPLIGWRSSIEDQKEKMSKVALVSAMMNDGSSSSSIKLRFIRFIPEGPHKQYLWDFVNTIRRPREAYHYNGGIVIRMPIKESIEGILFHEKYHPRIEDLIERKPEIIEKWDTYSRDKKGNSIYYNEGALEKILNSSPAHIRKQKGTGTYLSLGEINSYALTGVIDSMVETATLTKIGLYEVGGRILEERGNFLQKIELLEEEGIVPLGTIEAGIVEIESRRMNSNGSIQEIEEVIKKSRKYLKKYPSNYYASRIHENIGELLMAMSEIDPSQDYLKSATIEFNQALNSRFFDKDPYCRSLYNLKNIYSLQNNDKYEKAFDEAITLFRKRGREGDMLLPKRRVNDYLMGQEVLPPHLAP